jgi:hypothetical protein
MFRRLFQLGVFGLGLFEDGVLGVRLFPQYEEIMVRSRRLGRIALHRIGPPETEMRKRANRLVADNTEVIQNLEIQELLPADKVLLHTDFLVAELDRSDNFHEI